MPLFLIPVPETFLFLVEKPDEEEAIETTTVMVTIAPIEETTLPAEGGCIALYCRVMI